MKTENQQFNGSPKAVNYFKWSIAFFRENDLTTVGCSLIPDDLLRAWVAPDPQQLLSDMADHKAEPDSTLPFFRAPTVITTRFMPLNSTTIRTERQMRKSSWISFSFRKPCTTSSNWINGICTSCRFKSCTFMLIRRRCPC